jgi:hypothetical protein
VQEAVNEHRGRLAELEDTLKKIKSNPTVINEAGFKQKLQDVQERVHELLKLAKSGSGSELDFVVPLAYSYNHSFGPFPPLLFLPRIKSICTIYRRKEVIG